MINCYVCLASEKETVQATHFKKRFGTLYPRCRDHAFMDNNPQHVFAYEEKVVEYLAQEIHDS